MNKLVSVIIPVYMIDKYLGLCIESIINQRYKDLEIILVDDGSKDRSSAICDLYASKDKRIKVIHTENGGLVSARKAGLLLSTGDYIAYVDGDDWIGPGFIEALLYAAEENDADIVCAGFSRDLFSQSVKIYNAVQDGVYEGQELKELCGHMISYGRFYRPGITTYVWNKLFKRNIVYKVQINVDDLISLGEDAAVSYPAINCSDKVVVIDNTEYHYRQREDSMLKQKNEYSEEAQKLKHLYRYLEKWAVGTEQSERMRQQVIDYVLANAIMRSGGRTVQDSYSVFERVYYGKRVVIYSAGTFGQQLINRINETKHCEVLAWVDDDYWEYRRCCLDVDPVESIERIEFDYIIIAKVDREDVDRIVARLGEYNIGPEKILTVSGLTDKEALLDSFLDL